MKNAPNNSFLRLPPATCAAMILCSLPLAATAADVYWDSNDATAGAGTAPTGNWGTSAFWSSDATGASATVDTWNSGDTAVFSAGSDATSPYTITLNADTAAAGLKFEEGSPITFVSAGGAKSLTLDSNLDVASRTVIFGSSASAATTVNLLLGSNSVTLNSGALELYGNNTMASALLKGGTAIIGNANAFGTTGTVTMGNTAANSSVTLRMRNLTLSRPIVLQSETGFTTNATLNNIGFLSPIVTGGITSTGSGTTNLTIDSIISGSGSSLTFTVSGANPINHTGALTLRNTGTGTNSPTGTLDISAPIGSNVTTVTVNDTSGGVKGLQRVILGSTGNAWTGATTINSPARLELSAGEVIPHGSGKGDLTVNGTLDLRAATGNSTETINGLSGSGTITRSGASGTSTLVIGSNDTSSSFTGSIGQTAGTVALTKAGIGTLGLSGTNTYSGNTTIANNTGIVAITNGAALGTGTIAITRGGVSTGTLELSNDITVANSITFASATAFGAVGSSAQIRNVSGNNTLTGTLTLTGTGGNGINLESVSGLLTVSNTITSMIADNTRQLGLSGTGDGLITGNIVNTGINKFTVTKSGSGTWTLSGTNSYTGGTNVNTGTLVLTNNGGIADTASVNVATGATLKLDFAGSDTVGSLVLGGTTLGPGTYSASHPSGRLTGTGSLVVPNPDPFTPWITSPTFALAVADQDKTDDPDGDGLNSLLEFALDGNPASGTTTGKVVSKIDAGHLTLTLPVRSGATFTGTGPLISAAIGSVIYRIDGDDDLSGFTSGIEEVSALSADLPTLTTGWSYRTFRLTTPVTGASKGFLRAGVSVAP